MSGKSGNGIDFVKHNFTGRSQEQIDPRKSLAVQRPVNGFGGLLNLFRDILRYSCRNMDCRGLSGVFFCKVKESKGHL